MLRIAICDDMIDITSQLEEMIIDLCKKHNVEVDIDVFFSGRELLNYIENGSSFDLIFLDIEMELVDGIQTGKAIRETIKDDDTQIAFISGKPQYAMELFQIRPINFLIKPLLIEEVEDVLLTSIRLNNTRNKYFIYKKGRSYHKIKLKDILYFESDSRKVKIFTKNGVDSFYSLMDDIYHDTNNSGFLYIHKSYIVNTIHIKSYMYDKVILTNDMELPISQSKRKSIRDRLLIYFLFD